MNKIQRVKYTPFINKRLERRGRKKFFLTTLFGIALLFVLFAWLLPALIGSLAIVNRFKSHSQPQSPISENATLMKPPTPQLSVSKVILSLRLK
jgi:cytoskeletal protein RodZ